jgi:hypothetical protein
MWNGLTRDSIGTMSIATPAVDLSVVIPCYNEEESLPRLVEVLRDELGAITDSYESSWLMTGVATERFRSCAR